MRPASGLFDLRLDNVHAEVALFGDARRLQQRVLRADVWVEAAAARGHGIAGDERIAGEAFSVR